MSDEELRARLDEAEEAWLFHEATRELIAGYGYHMMQMLYRLPRDGQTSDMQASIEQMLADQRTALDRLAAAEARASAAEARLAGLRAAVEGLELRAKTGADAWGACSHEWLRIEELTAILAEHEDIR